MTKAVVSGAPALPATATSRALVRLQAATRRLAHAPSSVRSGRLVRVSGLILDVEGLPLAIDQRALIRTGDGRTIEACCVSFQHGITQLMALDAETNVGPGALVYPAGTPADAGDRFELMDRRRAMPIGLSLLGRIVDGFGRPLDDLPITLSAVPGQGSGRLNPLTRKQIDQPMDVGVRAINGLLTVGRGQRMGIFAGTGVGKSLLLGMLARNSEADVVVVGLIGERGREVREFVEDILGAQALKHSVLVVATADSSPLARVRGAWFATDVATWFRDQGHHVLLIMDSLSRFAMAQREIALGLGEPPVARGYPPSVFQRLPELVERVGNSEVSGGSVTAFYTVLLDDDDSSDPLADTARGVLDGHVYLSRSLAEAGHYPAIDIERSISRVMPRVASAEQVAQARQIKRLFGRFMRGRDMVAMGAYSPGADPELDTALRCWPAIASFLQQSADEVVNHGEALDRLAALGLETQRGN
jgi:flagellum-specific ATP synthase